MPHQQFFSFRNGVVAKAFHDAGDPHPRIFGLQVPQLAAIAREIGTDHQRALKLWQEKECRESRLLACWLFDPSKLDIESAAALARDTISREETDILSWKLLGHLPFAHDLLGHLSGYPAEALARNLVE